MKVHFSCKSCGTRYSALPEQTGKKGTCKSCGGDIIVPTLETTEFKIADDCRDQIKHLAFIVNDGLTEYITIHDRIFKEAATFKSVLKNVFGGAVPMSQLLQDAERLIPIWNGITEKITSFGSKAYSSMDEDERYYFDILNRYAQSVNETVVALVKRQKLLDDRSKGGQNNPVNWSEYQEAEKTYESAIKKYMAIGQELNNEGHLVFESKYSTDEKQYLKLAQEHLETSFGEKEAKKIAKELLNKAIEESEKLNLRGVTNLGQLHLEDQEFLVKRFAVGIRREDILAAWNRDYVWILIEDEIANLLKLPIYQRLVENEGLSSKEAVKAMRKTSPYFGDPEQTHENYQGEDADIYPEFKFRFDRWREKYLTEQLQQLLNSFSSYNAMIRHFIRKGEI